MSKPIANSYCEQLTLLDPEKPCRVYRNLHTGLWSVKQGVIRFHTSEIVLTNAKFVVSEAGRQRVLREQRKNVHAYVVGYIYPPVSFIAEEVYYNPYTCSSFMVGERPILKASMARLAKYADNKMRVFAKYPLTKPLGSDTIEKVPVHLL
jgi:hypothetical protein